MLVRVIVVLLLMVPAAGAASGPFPLWSDAQLDATSGSVREPDGRADLIQLRMTELPDALELRLLTRESAADAVLDDANPDFAATSFTEVLVKAPTGEVSALRIVLDNGLTVSQDGVARTNITVVDGRPDGWNLQIPKAGFWPGRGISPADEVGGAYTIHNATGAAGTSQDRGPDADRGPYIDLDGGMDAITFVASDDEGRTNAAGPAVDWAGDTWQAAWMYAGDPTPNARPAGIYWTSAAGTVEQVATVQIGNSGRQQDRVRVALDAAGPTILSQTTVDIATCEWRVFRGDGWLASNPIDGMTGDCSLGATGDLLVMENTTFAAVPTDDGFVLRADNGTGNWTTVFAADGSSPRLAAGPVIAWYEGGDQNAQGRVLFATAAGNWTQEELANSVPNDSGRTGLEAAPAFDMDVRPDGVPGFIWSDDAGRWLQLGDEPKEELTGSGSIMDLDFDAMGNAHIVQGFGTSGSYQYRTVYGDWRTESAAISRMASGAASDDGRIALVSTEANGGSALSILVGDASPFPPDFAPRGAGVELGKTADVRPPADNGTSNSTAPAPAPPGQRSPGLLPGIGIATAAVLQRRRGRATSNA